MRKDKNYRPIKESRLPTSLFVFFFAILNLMSGIHTGLIVLVNHMEWHVVVQCIIPMIYWGMVAVGVTLLIRSKIRDVYEKPMHKMAEATSRVANGDFSVYVPTFHTQDKWDYLDVMIMNFNKMVEELGSIETLKTDFVSNVSHEMKTPVAIIKNYAGLLKRESITEEQKKEYAKNIEGAATRLSNLISNILKLNKLENQRIMPEVEAYNVCRQLCDCILQFEDAWDEKDIELETEIEDVAMVEIDASLLEIVWNNLLSNAIKFIEPGGSVSVKQTSEESYIKISVSDTGCGMNDDVITHIFDKFYQGDTSHSKEGNGLGLALVKRVLELMDGDIQVFSELGRGSTFLVTLPAAGVFENKDGGNQ